jgi:hypothetical protein
MHSLIFATLLGLAQVPPAPAPAPATAPVVAAQTVTATPLTFYSESFPFQWDRMIPLANTNLGGLKVNSIFFNKRAVKPGAFNFLKDAEFGTRAQVEVTNTGLVPRIPGFAVAVLDKDGRLLGVATGGTKVGTVKPGETETFDLNFTQVKERLASGDKFLLAIELRN